MGVSAVIIFDTFCTLIHELNLVLKIDCWRKFELGKYTKNEFMFKLGPRHTQKMLGLGFEFYNS